MAEAPILPMRAAGISVAFGATQVLHAIDLDLGAGTRTVILGANGAGKSVLLRALHGLVPLSGGSIRWNGAAARPSAQAMVFQRPVMLRRSALANVAYALGSAASRGKAARHSRCRPLNASDWHRSPTARRACSPAASSSAWRSRAPGRLRPMILFMDEPTASLDPGATREVERVIGEIHGSGTKIVMTTHNLGQARRLADEIVFLNAGRIVEQTPAASFFDQPRSPEAAAYLEGVLPWAPHSHVS